MVAPAVASVASNDNDSIDYTVAVPAGTANGDLLIAVNASDWGTFAGNNIPAAFTRLATSKYDAGTNAFHVDIGYRIANSEPANYTFGQDGSASVGAILRITGADSTPTIAQVAPNNTDGGKTAPTITPNGSDDLLITFHAGEISGSGANTWTPPTGMTEHIDRQSTIWTSLEVCSLQSPSSPSGTKAATPSIAVNTGAGCTISIKSTASGATNLVIQDMSIATTEDAVTIVPIYNLAVADLSVSTSEDVPTLTRIMDLAIQKMLVATRHDAADFSQVYNIAINKMFLQTASDIVNFGSPGGKVSIADIQAQKLPVLTGKTGSVPDLLQFYYGGLSGLVPLASYSVVDHQRAYYKAQTGLGDNNSLADLEKAFYDTKLVPSGTLADRAFVYWSGL